MLILIALAAAPAVILCGLMTGMVSLLVAVSLWSDLRPEVRA